MQAARPPFLRGVLLLAALAAIAIIMARGDNPAAATSYNPTNVVSVSDPSPGAAADIKIDFSLNAPDAFPNVKTKSTIQFIPRSWGVHTPETDGASAPQVGGIAGSFNALTSLGLFGVVSCFYEVPVPFTMIDATTDTSKLASALDLGTGKGPGGTDAHPGGAGYSGQFVDDPETLQTPGDLGQPLRGFNSDEKYIRDPWDVNGPYDESSSAYRDVDGNNKVSAGDVRLTDYPPVTGGLRKDYFAGSVVQDGDLDESGFIGTGFDLFPFNTWRNPGVKHSNPDGTGQMDAGENVYQDVDYSGTVSYGDIRLFPFAQVPFGSTVADFSLPGGVSRYPDFLNQMFPSAVVGEPLARQWGGQMVAGQSAVSLNIVTFRPGQLPGYPATLGYPNIVILLNPVAPVDVGIINVTSDLCTPLSLTSTNLGVSQDNPSTAANEAGYVRLTNPKAEKSHEFTLVTTSQPDADNDGIENMLDTCPLTPNTDQDERGGGSGLYGLGADTDALEAACDPDPLNPSPLSPALYEPDEDVDNYANRADNCPLVANGIEVLDLQFIQLRQLVFNLATTGDNIPPGGSNQLDTDGDDLGDACDPDPYSITGHMHVVTIPQGVPIFKHGVKLNNLGGPQKVKDGGARNYSVDVSNLSGSASEDVQVALRVVEGCATVNGAASQNTAVVSVAPGTSGTASFTVDWTGCAVGEYTLQADACHAGDAAPAGFFGSGACPGVSDGMTDPNPLDDAPIAQSVVVGSP